MSDARQRAEEALAFMDAALLSEMPPLPTQVKALANAVRALLAETAPAPPQAREVEEAAERLACAATEFASQYGQTALSCHYDNGCEESGREEPCPPCGLRIAMESVRLLAALARGGA